MGDMANFYNDLYGIDIDEALRRKHPTTTFCRKCKIGNLTWKQHKTGKYWLYDGKNWHKCPIEERCHK